MADACALKYYVYAHIRKTDDLVFYVGVKGVHSGNIHKACRAHGATAYQHTWAYVDEPQNTEIKE